MRSPQAAEAAGNDFPCIHGLHVTAIGACLPVSQGRGIVMHVIAAIVGMLGALGAWWFVFRRAADAADQAVDAAQTVRGAFKRRAFRKRSEESVLAGVDSPAIAAAIFLCRVGQAGSLYDDEVKARIRAMMSEEMGQAEVEEAFAFADWAANSVINDDDIARRFAPLWKETLADREISRFGEMAREIAGFHGSAGRQQREMIAYLEQKTGATRH